MIKALTEAPLDVHLGRRHQSSFDRSSHNPGNAPHADVVALNTRGLSVSFRFFLPHAIPYDKAAPSFESRSRSLEKATISINIRSYMYMDSLHVSLTCAALPPLLVSDDALPMRRMASVAHCIHGPVSVFRARGATQLHAVALASAATPFAALEDCGQPTLALLTALAAHRWRIAIVTAPRAARHEAAPLPAQARALGARLEEEHFAAP